MLGGVDLRLDRGDDALGDPVLQREEVGDVAVVLLGPDLQAASGIVEERRGAEPLAGAPDAAAEHVAHAELAADRLQVGRAALPGEGGVAGRDEERRGRATAG